MQCLLSLLTGAKRVIGSAERHGYVVGTPNERAPLPRSFSSGIALDVRAGKADVLPAETNRKIKAAMDRAKAAGRPIEKLTFKMICDIMQDKFKPPWSFKLRNVMLRTLGP